MTDPNPHRDTYAPMPDGGTWATGNAGYWARTDRECIAEERRDDREARRPLLMDVRERLTITHMAARDGRAPVRDISDAAALDRLAVILSRDELSGGDFIEWAGEIVRDTGRVIAA